MGWMGPSRAGMGPQSWVWTVQSGDGTPEPGWDRHTMTAAAVRVAGHLRAVAAGRDSAVGTVGSCCFGDLQNRHMSYVKKKKTKKECVSSSLDHFWKGLVSSPFHVEKHVSWTR